MPPLGEKALANRKKFLKNRRDPRHGTPNGYCNLGCHCKRCTAAWRKKHYEYMHSDPKRIRRHAENELKRKGVKRQVPYRSKSED